MNTSKENVTVPIWQKVTLTIEEAAQLSNIGIKKLYDLTNTPSCDFVIYIGKKRRLIKRDEFEKFLKKSYEI